jgi:hypothetical protein
VNDLSTHAYNYDGQQPLMYCPNCQSDLTLARPERGEIRPPKAGDQTVCFHCLAYLRYAEPEPGQLRFDTINRESFEALPEQLQIGLMQVRAELATRASPVPTKWEAALARDLTALKGRVAVLEAGACSCHYCSSGDSYNCTYRRKT